MNSNLRRTIQITMKNRGMSLPRAVLLGVLLFVVALSAQSQSPESKSGQWRIAGQNLSNTWSQPAEDSISPANVSGLSPKWVFTTGGDVSATPTVDGDQLIIGDILNSKKVHNGANVISVDRETGTLRWMTQVDAHPAAEITGSPVVFDGVVYIGVSSNEETLALDPAYPCCSFRGSIVALDAKTGEMLWKTFDMPDNGGQPGGYSGGAIWQPPAIDPKRGTLFVGTGNNYTAPAD